MRSERPKFVVTTSLDAQDFITTIGRAYVSCPGVIFGEAGMREIRVIATRFLGLVMNEQHRIGLEYALQGWLERKIVTDEAYYDPFEGTWVVE